MSDVRAIERKITRGVVAASAGRFFSARLDSGSFCLAEVHGNWRPRRGNHLWGLLQILGPTLLRLADGQRVRATIYQIDVSLEEAMAIKLRDAPDVI